MAGKHRKPARRRSTGWRRSVPGVTAAAVSATSLSTALMTGTTTTVTAAVELTAVITPANSTSQIFAGTTYYKTDWTNEGYGQQQIVPFFLGPQGIVDAVHQNSNQSNVILSSGWGAGQTSTALAMMQNDPTRKSVKLVILDNNTNRAGGGFWTTYWMFAPLFLTSAAPTPNNLDVPVVDAGYEYNINSDAPTYPINVLADANSLMAYAYGYGAQSTAPMPDDAITEAQTAGPGQHNHYIVAPDGSYTTVPVKGNITYVTFQSDGLPLVRPLRMLPGGDIVANAIEPTATVLVNAGYKDNQPIPNDPTATRPVGLFPSATETTATVNGLPGSVQKGLQGGVTTAQQDLSSPTNFVTKPIGEITNTTGIVTNNLPTSSLPTSSLPLNTVNMAGGNKVVPGTNTAGAASSTGSNPVKQVVGGVSSAFGGAADKLSGAAQRAATPGKTSGAS